MIPGRAYYVHPDEKSVTNKHKHSPSNRGVSRFHMDIFLTDQRRCSMISSRKLPIKWLVDDRLNFSARICRAFGVQKHKNFLHRKEHNVPFTQMQYFPVIRPSGDKNPLSTRNNCRSTQTAMLFSSLGGAWGEDPTSPRNVWPVLTTFHCYIVTLFWQHSRLAAKGKRRSPGRSCDWHPKRVLPRGLSPASLERSRCCPSSQTRTDQRR